MLDLKNKLKNTLLPIANSMQLNIGNINIFGKQTTTVQIFLEKIDGTSVSIKECGVFSKQANIAINVAEILNNYSLEVSSFGIDRPLLTEQDYEKFKGNNILIKTKFLVNNVKKFNGVLQGIENNSVMLLVNNTTVAVPLNAIEKANLDIVKNININKLK